MAEQCSAVQRNAVDAEAYTTLLEPGRPVVRARPRQTRKQ
jgi:hypothetical protein